jgi:hypothetical protein
VAVRQVERERSHLVNRRQRELLFFDLLDGETNLRLVRGAMSSSAEWMRCCCRSESWSKLSDDSMRETSSSVIDSSRSRSLASRAAVPRPDALCACHKSSLSLVDGSANCNGLIGTSPVCGAFLERTTGFEPATLSLGS